MRMFDVQGIEIMATCQRVFEFVKQPANLPQSPGRTRTCGTRPRRPGIGHHPDLGDGDALDEGPGRSLRAWSCATSALRYRAVVVRFVWPSQSDTACMG